MIHLGCVLFVAGVLIIVGIIKGIVSICAHIDDLNIELRHKKDENDRLRMKIYLLENK